MQRTLFGCGPVIVNSRSGLSYLMLTSSWDKPHPAAKKVHHFDIVTAEVFIRQIDAPMEEWNHFVDEHYRPNPVHAECTRINNIAQQVLRDKIRFYELPRFWKKQLAYNGKDRCYGFLRGPGELTHLGLEFRFENIQDKDQAKVLVKSLQTTKAFWLGVLYHTGLFEWKLKDKRESDIEDLIIGYLMADELCAYHCPYVPPVPKAPKLEDYIHKAIPPAAPSDEPENWIDMQYLYADGKGVSCASYIVKDAANGAELARGKLSAEGTAYSTLPLNVTAVTVEYYDDPVLQTVLKPVQPKAGDSPSGWFDRMGSALQSAWDTTTDSMKWGWGVVQGDFNENPTVAQIITNAVITMIPVVDQVADVRDIVANVKALVWDKKYNEFGPWLALFFTLIGLIPTLGSALKGILKLVWKGAKLDELLKVFNWFMKGNGVKWLKELQGGKLKQYANQAAEIGQQIFSAIIDKVKGVQAYIPKTMVQAHRQIQDTLETLDKVKSQINGMFDKIAQQMNEKLGKILEEAEPQVGQAPAKGNFTKKQEKAKPPEDGYTPREGLPPLDGDRVYKRDHLDGDPKDPYTLKADGKPLGAKEGVMPKDAKGLKKLDPEYQKLIEEQGYPDVASREDFLNFSDIKPVELQEGDKIYRIVDEGSAEAGGRSGTYWARELPANKTEWRSNYAVKDSWNDNGYYVEHTVGPEGMKAWEGTTAGQQYDEFAGKNFYLEGGQQQLYVEYNSISGLQPKTTNWTDAAQ